MSLPSGDTLRNPVFCGAHVVPKPAFKSGRPGHAVAVAVVVSFEGGQTKLILSVTLKNALVLGPAGFLATLLRHQLQKRQIKTFFILAGAT